MTKANDTKRDEGRRGRTWALSFAPMMGRTDRHFRYFARLITRQTLLYTPMVTASAVLRGDRDKLLGYDPAERPLALQLGGDDPAQLAAAARIAADLGYDEVNLNAGCPSPRVRQGSFGAALMLRPERVADCVAAMRAACRLPVTVKHRIGVDDRDGFDDVLAFVETVAAAGCDRFVVHARKAVAGLSPKDNRSVPPLRVDRVYRLKEAVPHLAVEVNGGVVSPEDAAPHLAHVDGVMVGRAAYDTPYRFATADALLFGRDEEPLTRAQVIAAMIPYVEVWSARGVPPLRVVRHMLGLYAGRPGARLWRRQLGDSKAEHSDGGALLRAALARVRQSPDRD